MKKIHFTSLYALLTVSAVFAAEEYLSPVDFGFSLTDHGYVDLSYHPPGVVMGNFNRDDYPDIARIQGKCLEVYINRCGRYDKTPAYSKYYDQHLINIRCEGEVWLDYWDIIVTQADGSEDRIENRMGQLCIESTETVYQKYSAPPRQVSEADFQLVWESEHKPWGMTNCAVGDVDNDDIMELCTWWKESEYADTAYILIYKCTGDDQYDLFMQERFFTDNGVQLITQMLITDYDQNGQKELLYTLDREYFWEFSAPGQYTFLKGLYPFFRTVQDVVVSDIDQDGILELGYVTSHSMLQPPCIYTVREFAGKGATGFSQNLLIERYQDWQDYRLDIDDFDNDGICDIVSGSANLVWTYEPVSIQYFRYDTSVVWNCTQHWLNLGVASSCLTPIIEDFDNDGLKELFAVGLTVGNGSALIWKGIGFENGTVVWRDTTTINHNPHESSFGVVDGRPSTVTSLSVYFSCQATQLTFFNFETLNSVVSWESPILDSLFYMDPWITDLDWDGKKDIAAAVMFQGISPNFVHIWEQTSAGINLNFNPWLPANFVLYQNYPNPFNNSTEIKYKILEKTDISIKIYNVIGEEVFSHSEQNVLSGIYVYNWDAEGLTSGVYFIHLKTKTGQKTVKSIILK